MGQVTAAEGIAIIAIKVLATIDDTGNGGAADQCSREEMSCVSKQVSDPLVLHFV